MTQIINGYMHIYMPHFFIAEWCDILYFNYFSYIIYYCNKLYCESVTLSMANTFINASINKSRVLIEFNSDRYNNLFLIERFCDKIMFIFCFFCVGFNKVYNKTCWNFRCRWCDTDNFYRWWSLCRAFEKHDPWSS